MTQEQKIKIIEAAKQYVEDHKASGMSQNKLAQQAGINGAYISTLFQLKMSIGSPGKESVIKDSVYQKIAVAIGYSLKKAYWETVMTPEMKQMVVTLTEAKKSGKTAMLIGVPGSGKTFSLSKFVTNNPVNTFRIVASSIYNLNDLLFEMLHKLQLETSGTKARRLHRIAERLRDIKHNGGLPILIIDEAENLKQPAFQMIKALYDAVRDYCSIVLIGTPRLITKLENMVIKDKDGMPQFYRRFKAGCRWLPEIDKTFSMFLGKYQLETGLKKLLIEMCDNYGELNDYLEPFLREADALGKTPSEELFRLMYHIPARLRRA